MSIFSNFKCYDALRENARLLLTLKTNGIIFCALNHVIRRKCMNTLDVVVSAFVYVRQRFFNAVSTEQYSVTKVILT